MMQIPLQITFQEIEPSDAVETRIRKEVDKLQRMHDRITSCRVVVSQPHHRRHEGDLYVVRVDITIPGNQEIVVNREHGDRQAHADIYVAIRDAFRSARRRLLDRTAVLRGEIKSHVSPATGRVTQIFPTKDYGFIRGTDGQDVYFHRNAVPNGAFDELSVGDEVRYQPRERESLDGPQASTVVPYGKRMVVGLTP